jgi:hypothetical protein
MFSAMAGSEKCAYQMSETDPRRGARESPLQNGQAGSGFQLNNWSLQLTAVNITNALTLYNLLSTFSGTHYVSP